MDVRMEVDAVTKNLDYCHYSRHKLKACGREKISQVNVLHKDKNH